MRQHGPEAPQGGSGHANAERRQVPLQERPHEALQPEKGGRVRPDDPRFRKAAAQPTAGEAIVADLVETETARAVVVDPARKRFRCLAEQTRGSASQHRESRRPRAARRSASTQGVGKRSGRRCTSSMTTRPRSSPSTSSGSSVRRFRSAELSRSSQWVGPVYSHPIGCANVVLPICRGPRMAATGNARSRCKRMATCCFREIIGRDRTPKIGTGHPALRMDAQGRRMCRPYRLARPVPSTACLSASLILCAKMNHRIPVGPRKFCGQHRIFMVDAHPAALFLQRRSGDVGGGGAARRRAQLHSIRSRTSASMSAPSPSPTRLCRLSYASFDDLAAGDAGVANRTPTFTDRGCRDPGSAATPFGSSGPIPPPRGSWSRCLASSGRIHRSSA